MSNEEIAENLEVTSLDGSIDMVFRREGARRLRDGMYWQPMTSESKFEDGEAYLLREREDGGAVLGSWQQYPYGFSIKAERYLEDRKQYTHYARITEPN